MQVILLQDVAKVGKRYEVKNVANGYALNFLIPRQLARAATPEAIADIEQQKQQKAESQALTEQTLAEALTKLTGTTIEIQSKVNEQGHLFAALHEKEVVAAVEAQTGVIIDKESIQLEHPIKEVGEHTVNVVKGETTGTLNLNVVAE